jgi:hypothetical protein
MFLNEAKRKGPNSLGHSDGKQAFPFIMLIRNLALMTDLMNRS